jgi:hypothetical protein
MNLRPPSSGWKSKPSKQPARSLSACFLLFAWLAHRLWRWKRYVPTKRRIFFTAFRPPWAVSGALRLGIRGAKLLQRTAKWHHTSASLNVLDGPVACWPLTTHLYVRHVRRRKPPHTCLLDSFQNTVQCTFGAPSRRIIAAMLFPAAWCFAGRSLDREGHVRSSPQASYACSTHTHTHTHTELGGGAVNAATLVCGRCSVRISVGTPALPVESQQTFRRNMSPQSSGSKNEPSKKPQAETLVSCMVYSSAMKIVATCPSETSVDFHRTTRHYIPEDSALQSFSWVYLLSLPVNVRILHPSSFQILANS